MRLSAYNIFVSKRNVAIALGDAAISNGLLAIGMDHYRLNRRYTLLPCGVNLPRPWSELQHQQVDQLTLNQWVQRKLDKEIKYVLFAGAFDNAVKDPELAKSVIAIYNSSIANSQSPIANSQIELIELKGYTRDQVTALMYNCHALLMTSKTEGSPQVVKEAMACGCPIVSVDVGDVAERIEGVEGCHVVPTREPRDIANALSKAIEFNGRTNGREKIIEMRLTNSQVAERLMTIYKSLV
jgi:glycosyltransferase involved in cell wall biosynthesis